MKQMRQDVSSRSASRCAGNRDRQAFVTRQLTRALLHMLKTQGISTIRVSELCQQAQVSRVSFYRNFDSKEAILKADAKRLLGSCLEGGRAEGAPVSGQMLRLFKHLEAHSDFYLTLYRQGQLEVLKSALVSRTEPQADLPPETIYACAFFTFALYGWIETWLSRGMRESPERLAEMFARQGL